MTKEVDDGALGEDARPTPEVRLLFFGTFFHENTELTADLIQLKETARITEIRVIPLGATVDLSTGAFQLGATNPSEFDVEFYYNDLQVPSKSTFELLRNFKFNDKARIQLVCNSAEEILTDGLLVRGIYSTVTLAVYGYIVDKVPIKEIVTVTETKKETPIAISVHKEDASESLIIDEDAADEIQSPERAVAANFALGETEREAEVLIPLEMVNEKPSAQAIPTITTRVNYDSVPDHLTTEEEQMDTTTNQGKSSCGDDEDLDTIAKAGSKESSKVVTILPEDTEEISDGEVFPSDDEDSNHSGKMEVDVASDADVPKSLVKASRLGESNESTSQRDINSGIVDPLIEEVEPISSPPQDQLSDVDDSLVDEFQEAGIEEIISDEEIDFPDYDYGEWDENWAHKFTKAFNPFSEAFQVCPLKQIGTPNSNGIVNRTAEQCWELLNAKLSKYSRDKFISTSNIMELWVEELEKVLPILPFALSFSRESETSSELESGLWFWIEMGSNFDTAMQHLSLPFKTRHLKAGIRLIQCIANCEGDISEKLLRLRVPSEKFENVETSDGNEETDNSTTVQHRLISLLTKPYMSNVIKLLILRTLDAMISTKLGFEMFTNAAGGEVSCYQRLVELSVNSGFSTRMTYSLRSLSKKISVMEGLLEIEDLIACCKTEDINHEEIQHDDETLNPSLNDQSLKVLDDLLFTANNITQYFSHPLRILPAKSVVELPPPSATGHDPKLSFVRMLKETNFMKIAAVLINSKNYSGSVISQISELLLILLNWETGLVYICNESDTTTILIRSLLQQDDDISGIGCLIAHCTEVMKCVDTLLSNENCNKKGTEDLDDDVQLLQIVVSFLSSSVGRDAVVKTLKKGNFILPFLKCISPGDHDPRFSQLSRLEKSVRKGYAMEVVDFIIRTADSIEFLEKHGAHIFSVISVMNDSNEECEKLLLSQAFLKPALNPKIFNLDGLETLWDLIKIKKTELLQLPRNPENNWGFPAEMITALRVLDEIATSPEDNDVSKNLLVGADELLVRQLKHDIAIVKLHSLDVSSTIIAILQRLVDEFAFPAMHSHTFVSSRGESVIALLIPLVKILRKTVTHVIHVRKADFRDTTAVPVLLKVYNLLESFPSNALSFGKVQEIQQNIIGHLLSYTIPAIKQGSETEEELNKSTWTAVLSEVIKFTMEEPANFHSGLKLLSEMLPLPLPMSSKTNLPDQLCMEAVKLRRLWSAYIHGLTSQLQEMIGILCCSTNARLLNLLKRVCVQLADLAASTCLAVCRSLLDTLILSIELESEVVITDPQLLMSQQTSSVKAWVDTAKGLVERQCSSQTSRILGLVASLVNNFAPLKCGILHVLKGNTKIDEKYCELLTSVCSILLTFPSSTTANTHIQAQDHVVTIFQSFCDLEINMLTPMFGKSEQRQFDSDLILANSVPSREHLVNICTTLASYLSSFDCSSPSLPVLEGVLRTVEIIAETEYGFHHLKTSFEKQPGTIKKVCEAFLSSENWTLDLFESVIPCIMSLLDLLKSITNPRPQQMGSFPPRCAIMKPEDIRRMLEWTSGDSIEKDATSTKAETIAQQTMIPNQSDADDSTSKMEQEDIPAGTDETVPKVDSVDSTVVVHPFLQLRKCLENQQLQINEGQISFTSVESNDILVAMGTIDSILEFLNNSTIGQTDTEAKSFEIQLTAPETLQEIFAVRPVYVIVDKLGSDNLPVFWITSIPPAFELDTDLESDLVVCDLDEMSRNYLNGFDVAKQIQSLSKASELQSSDDTKQDSKYPSGNGQMRAPHAGSLLHLHRRSHYPNSMRGSGRGMFSRGMATGRNMYDPFRSRPPNTSRPPSLHVDDFVALESGPQTRQDNFSGGGRGGRGRGSNISSPYERHRGGGRGGQNSGYYQGRRHGSPNMAHRGGGRGGRVFSTPNSDRWTAEPRNNGGGGGGLNVPSYDRNRSGNYEEKYNNARSSSVGGPSRNSVTSSPRSHPYAVPRTGYRDPRTATSTNVPRWRERQNKPFSR